MNLKVDAFLRRAKQWQPELTELRRILLDCPLTEEFKWRAPCYTFEQGNVVIIGGFKAFCSLSFFKGALLKDPHGILEKPGENTQAGRLVRFTNMAEIIEQEAILKAYIAEAIDVERTGSKVQFKDIAEQQVPEELQARFAASAEFAAAFHALTPGRQRGYLLHFAAPKQSKTRQSRIEKCLPMILRGEGLHDHYLSARRKKK